jgi:hypothetical protein
MEREPEASQSAQPGPLLTIEGLDGDVTVWALGEDRFRIQSPAGIREIEGYERAQELARALARLGGTQKPPRTFGRWRTAKRGDT